MTTEGGESHMRTMEALSDLLLGIAALMTATTLAVKELRGPRKRR
jgi:hypothetical protein